VSFTTLRMVYQGALFNIRAGQTNSVLVITAGPHTPTKPSTGRDSRNFIRRSVDPARPGGGQRHQLPCRPGPGDLGNRCQAQRRRLPQRGDVGLSRPGRRGEHCQRQVALLQWQAVSATCCTDVPLMSVVTYSECIGNSARCDVIRIQVPFELYVQQMRRQRFRE
jgi:hypothetical protein